MGGIEAALRESRRIAAIAAPIFFVLSLVECEPVNPPFAKTDARPQTPPSSPPGSPPGSPSQPQTPHRKAPARPPPACPETLESGAWARPDGFSRIVPGKLGSLGHLEQDVSGQPLHLRFLGTHVFDLLDKLIYEGGGIEASRRRVACLALDAVARSGAPVVRLWGSLKQTGTPSEVKWAAEALALLLDENARRERPLRFIVTLQNHQAGYGAPDSSRSLDDQDPKSPFFARRFYLEGGWKEKGTGTLADRIDAFAAKPEIANDPAILGFELVNELDTFRSIAHGTFEGPEARVLAADFISPALGYLADRLPHLVLLGDMRGHDRLYSSFMRGWIEELPPALRARLVWTGHVYTTLARSPTDPALARATSKLDRDLDLARSLGLPFLLGELGQHVPQSTPRFCRGGAAHDLAQVFSTVLDASAERRAMEMVLFWGEGLCDMALPQGGSISLGAGGDSADIGPDEQNARRALGEARRLARYLASGP